MIDFELGFREAARKLRIPESMLRTWKTQWDQLGDDAFPGKEKIAALEAELAKLLEEKRKLQTEVDILKKAVAFFANEKI